MKKILVFTSTFNGGGAEKITLTLSVALQGRDYDVTVATLNACGVLAKRFNENLKIVDLHVSPSPSWLMRPRAFFRIRRLLQEQLPDVVLCSNLPMLAVVVQAALRTLRGKKPSSYQIEHGNFSQGVAYGSKLRGVVLKLSSRVFYPYFTKIVGVSDGVARDILNNHLTSRDKVVRIYNPVVSRDESLSLGEPPHVFFEQSGARVVLGIGVLAKGKGFPLLLRAFAALTAEMPELRLVILGEGDRRKDLETLARELKIEDKTAFPGFQQDIFPWLNRTAVLALPSYSEGLPTVIVEAMACGVTPVSTDCDFGPAEILENGRWGYLTPVGDAEGLAEGLRRALAEPFPPEELKRRAADFSLDKALQAYVKLFEEDAS